MIYWFIQCLWIQGQDPLLGMHWKGTIWGPKYLFRRYLDLSGYKFSGLKQCPVGFCGVHRIFFGGDEISSQGPYFTTHLYIGTWLDCKASFWYPKSMNPISISWNCMSIKNWMGPYQRTPKKVTRAIKYPGLGVRSVGPVGDFMELYGSVLLVGFFTVFRCSFGFWFSHPHCAFRMEWSHKNGRFAAESEDSYDLLATSSSHMLKKGSPGKASIWEVLSLEKFNMI